VAAPKTAAIELETNRMATSEMNAVSFMFIGTSPSNTTALHDHATLGLFHTAP
jgi:hypothetical protein